MYPSSQFSRKQVAAFSLVFLLCFCLTLFYSCKKNDFSVVQPAHDADFVQKFFALKHPVNDTVAAVMAKLKAENDRTGFVDKLPANCGLPVWDKLRMQKKVTMSFTGDDGKGDTTIILPLTNDNTSLSAIITATPDNDGYIVNSYTNNWLYNICHATNVDTAYANKQLTFFFFVENQTFGTTKFYHIPANLISRSTLLDSNGTKTITIEPVPDPVQGFMVEVCIYYVCPICYGQDPNCPLGGHWMECFNTGSDGGDGGGTTGGTGGGTGSGSGSGGGGGTGGSGPICPLTSNTTWYGLMPPPDPCGPPTPPAGPNPCDTLIAQLQNDANFISKFKELNTKGYQQVLGLDHEVGYAGQRANNLYIRKEGASGSGEIDWTPLLSSGTRYDFILHSHYDGLNSIFSAQDMVLMARMYLTGHIIDTATFYFGMTSIDGNNPNSPMLMKVTNAAAFKTFAQKVAGVNGTDENVSDKFEKKYKDSFNSSDPDANEVGFMQMLKENGGLAGLGVYRGNADCNLWSKLVLNGTSVSTQHCY